MIFDGVINLYNVAAKTEWFNVLANIQTWCDFNTVQDTTTML